MEVQGNLTIYANWYYTVDFGALESVAGDLIVAGNRNMTAIAMGALHTVGGAFLFEENDPTKRMLLIANFNNDLSEYWEFSDQGMFPIDLSNEAYKLGINYIVYALTR